MRQLARNLSAFIACLLDLEQDDHLYCLHAEDGTEYHWNATAGRRMAEANGPVFLFCPGDFAVTPEQILWRYRDLDVRYTLTTDLAQPLLFAVCNGESQLIDGWHRLFKAVLCGVPVLPAYHLTSEESDAVLVAKLPPGKGTCFAPPPVAATNPAFKRDAVNKASP